MIFKHIVKEGDDLNLLNNHVSQGKNAFILVYSDSCGHCIEVLPKWYKIETLLKDKYKNIDSMMVASVNVELLSKIPYFGNVDGVPTMKYIYDSGKKLETYEDSAVVNKDRETNSFIQWIEIKLDNHHSYIDKKTRNKVVRKTRNNKNNSKRHNKSKKSMKSKKQRGGKK